MGRPRWTLGLLPRLAVVNDAAVNMGVQTAVQIAAFNYLGCRPRGGIAGSYSDSMLNFLRRCQTAFCSGYATLHPHQQCVRVSISTSSPAREEFLEAHSEVWEEL